ncbi:MAG: hypothetical protein F4W92_08825 [Gammaproteobacteria bacterium]|nr:hypothetical protein [Gammaproteobacteria bacterium]
MNTRLIIVLLLICFYCTGSLAQGHAPAKPLKIRAIYPAGEEVAASDRITIEFNQNIVSLGASMFVDDVVPIDIEPAVDCEWNWVKLNTLQCDLPVDTDLDNATRYKVTVRPGIKAPNGQVLSDEYVHMFETILPAIQSTWLVSWKSPTQPILNVSFNQDLTLDSLQERLLMFDSVSGKEIPTEICPYFLGLNSEFRNDYFGQHQTYKIFDQTECDTDGRIGDDVLVLPIELLSPNARVSLILLPGVESATGSMTSQKRAIVDAETSTFNEFRLLGLLCQDVQGNDLFLAVDQTHEQTCKVHSRFRLVFSSRFNQHETGMFVQIHTPSTGENERASVYYPGSRHPKGYRYHIRGDFRSSLTYKILVVPREETGDSSENIVHVQDGFGRPLVGTNEITFSTDRPLPHLSVLNRSAVVDSSGTVEPQVSFGNVDDVLIIYDTLDEQGIRSNQKQNRQNPKQDDVLTTEFLGLRDVLRSPSGVMSGTLVSDPRFDHPEDSIESRFFVQATPYSVFLKFGIVESLAWVVDLHTGEPIDNAEVEFFLGDPRQLAANHESIFSGKTNIDGLINFPGYDSFDHHWDRASDSMFWECRDQEECLMYFLRVEGESGIALLPLDDNYRLDWSYWLYPVYRDLDHFATTSQNIYNPGDTVQIKGYVRTRHNEVRVIPQKGNFALCVRGPRGREYEISPISLNEFGAYHTSVKLIERTELGNYRISIAFDADSPITNPCFGGNHRQEGGNFKVLEFKTNPIQVNQFLNANVYERGDVLTIETHANFHAGGPYAHANGQVIVSVEAKDPAFETVSEYDYSISKNPSQNWRARVHGSYIVLDEQGRYKTTVESLDSEAYYGELQIESSVISDRGKAVASRTIAPYFGVDHFVAIHHPASYDRWTKSGHIWVDESWPIQVLVLSKDDKVVSGKEVTITVFAAIKDANGEVPDRYAKKEWEKILNCEVQSSEEPVSCDFTPVEVNFYRIEAQILDTKGNAQISSIQVDARVDYRPKEEIVKPTERVYLELICDSYEVEIGDKIRCEVKNSLGDSPMLVTIERASVIDEWLVRLDPKNPIFEFQVQEHYEPHFELSVLSQKPLSEATNSDDYRYRIATQRFTLDNPRLKPLEIRVSSNRDSFTPRDTVKLSISAGRNRDRTKPIEFAVVVVDQAILDLSDEKGGFFDPTKKVWDVFERVVRTYGLVASLMESSDLRSSMPTPMEDYTVKPSTHDDLVESRGGLYYNFNAGERTSNPNIRKVDHFVAYWNPSVVSTDGRARLELELPDNLTRWVALVMAVSANDRFGFASTNFASLKETEVRAVAPNVVTEGDKFQIGASILNRADRRRRLTIELHASGNIAELSGAATTFKQELNFQPFERRLVSWDVQADEVLQSLDLKRPINSSEIRFIASAGDRRDSDALDIRIPVRSNKVRVSSVAYGALDGDRTEIPVGIPTSLLNEDGQLDFTLSTTDKINFDGVFRYAIEYPYACWEQELTKAVLAMQYLLLEKRGTQHGIPWPDAEEKIAQVLAAAKDFQTPNGGMAYFDPRDGNSVPYLSAYTAIAFSWLENAGYDVPHEVQRNLLQYLHKFLAREEDEMGNAYRIGDEMLFNHIQATVGAVVAHALALSGELSDTELSTYSNQINQMDLFGLSQFLLAAVKLDPVHPLTATVVERIMNHRSLVDGAVEFVEVVPREFTRILHSDTRSLCSVLEALTMLKQNTSGGIEIGELQELANSVRYARDNLPCWRNTQDNVFCTNAMITFFDYVNSEGGDLVATIDLQSDDTGVSARLADGWEFNTHITKHHARHQLHAHRFGSHGAIEINRQGNGNAFYNVELSYLTTVDERINRYSGFEIHREYVALRDNHWHILKPGDYINKGEYILVNIYLNNRFERFHVVVDDSVPGGLEPVNLSLKTEFIPPFNPSELVEILSNSKLYKEFEEASGRYFRYRDLGLQNVRYFANRLKRGKHHLLWLGQAISAGEFTVLPTHVEEMYRPIMFGKSEPWTLIVKP